MNLWTLRAAHLDLWTSPVRPSSEDVGMFKNQLEAADKTLLLGVTQELEPLATLAVDHNPAVIEIHRAHAILADWAELPFESEFDAVIGDGCLNAFQGALDRLPGNASTVFPTGQKSVKAKWAADFAPVRFS